MERHEVIAILGIIKTAYPAFYKDMKKEDAESAISLWCQMFENDDPKIVTEAVKALVCSLKFPPSISDVKLKMQEITQPDKMTELEAWGLVKKAISNSAYNASEEFMKLPAIVRKIVGSPNQLREWAQIEIDELQTVVQSNFMRSFTSKQKQQDSAALMPESTKQLIAGLSEKFKMLE